jgi:hypothetical protein
MVSLGESVIKVVAHNKLKRLSRLSQNGTGGGRSLSNMWPSGPAVQRRTLPADSGHLTRHYFGSGTWEPRCDMKSLIVSD